MMLIKMLVWGIILNFFLTDNYYNDNWNKLFKNSLVKPLTGWHALSVLILLLSKVTSLSQEISPFLKTWKGGDVQNPLIKSNNTNQSNVREGDLVTACNQGKHRWPCVTAPCFGMAQSEAADLPTCVAGCSWLHGCLFINSFIIHRTLFTPVYTCLPAVWLSTSGQKNMVTVSQCCHENRTLKIF